MATWDDVREIVTALPAVTEGTTFGTASWKVDGKKLVVWERPLRKKDLEELGEAAPSGPVLGASVADEGEKWALVEGEPALFFTTAHFEGYAAVLVRLEAIGRDRLRELITEAWRSRAPKRLLDEFPA